MIVKSINGTKKQFNGVDFKVMAVGEKSMVTKMLYKKGNYVPLHSHPNEQSGYVISGKYKIKFQGYEELIQKGDSYSIPVNSEHSLEVIEPGEVIDVFTPPRKDYL